MSSLKFFRLFLVELLIKFYNFTGVLNQKSYIVVKV